MNEQVKRTPKEMAEAMIFATEETNRLLGSLMGVQGTVMDDAAVLARAYLDLLAENERLRDELQAEIRAHGAHHDHENTEIARLNSLINNPPQSAPPVCKCATKPDTFSELVMREFTHATVRVVDGKRSLVIETPGIAGTLALADGVMPRANRDGQVIRVFFQPDSLDGLTASTHEKI